MPTDDRPTIALAPRRTDSGTNGHDRSAPPPGGDGDGDGEDPEKTRDVLIQLFGRHLERQSVAAEETKGAVAAMGERIGSEVRAGLEAQGAMFQRATSAQTKVIAGLGAVVIIIFGAIAGLNVSGSLFGQQITATQGP
jgi:hypothetical protein